MPRDNRFIYQTTKDTITSGFVLAQLDKLSFEITRPTVVVLDNAKVHRAKKAQAMRGYCANRNLFIFFLPPYSPHLNIIERLWKELKARWVTPKDYATPEQLFYSMDLICNAIGKSLFVNFKKAVGLSII